MKKRGLIKKNLVKALAVMLVAIFMIPLISAASTSIRVVVNGSQVDFPDAVPYMDSNYRVLIPIRFVSEKLGAKVEWDTVNKKVTITDEEHVVVLIVGKKEITVNGVTKVLDTAASMKQARTYVPIRFVSEALGAKVEWDSNSKTVYINNDGKAAVKSEVIAIADFKYTLQEGDQFIREPYSEPYIDTASKASIIIVEEEGNNLIMVLQAAWNMAGGDYKQQCKEIEELLKQQITPNTLRSVMQYVRSKTKDEIELPRKDFVDTKYKVRVASNSNSTVDIYVYKK